MREPAPDVRERLRALPAVDRLAEAAGDGAASRSAARAVLAERRQELLAGAVGEVDLDARMRERLRSPLRRVVNATGVVLHTNLGRAPLPSVARAAVMAVAEGYTNLELDLADGRRGARHAHIERVLCELTGAEAAMAVNNCAGAVLLAVATMAGPGREVIASRGQMIEIGGGFRVPDVVTQSGATLVEVGTTNRTRRSDYAGAIGPQTGCILRAHPSNFRVVGFVEDVDVEELCRLGVPVVDDVGSGVLTEGDDLLAAEPSVRRSVAAGAALTTFSGDKLLGGPQAGLLVGRQDAVERAKAHPLARALRLDKLALAALWATLDLYRDETRARRAVPVLAMLHADESELQQRAQTLADAAGRRGRVVRTTARVGGGALPLVELEGPAAALDPGPAGADVLAAALRAGEPPVMARIRDDVVLLDPRTMTADEVAWAGEAVRKAMR